MSLNETIEFIRNILIRQEESGKIPKDYLDILTNIFNPNVIKQLDPELTAAIDEFLSKQFRGKPLSYWLVRVVRKDKNIRQMTVPVELTTEIEAPVGFGRPEVSGAQKDEESYAQRRKREAGKKLIEGEENVNFPDVVQSRQR